MSSLNVKYLCLALLILCHSAMAAAVKGNQMDRYDVTWETPGPGYAGSMPLGNGDIGLNAWVEDNGDLLFYISKTDAWDENLRLVKVGRVRVHFTPTPSIPAPVPLVPVTLASDSSAVTVPPTPSAFFRQTLHVGKGEMEVQLGAPEKGIHLALWVDANHPVVRLEAKSAQPVEMKVTSEVWRTEKRALTAGELHGAYLVPGQYKWSGPAIEATVDPDIVWKADDSLVWFHHNTRSIYRQNLEVQGLGEWADKSSDPLMGLTFGCLAKGPNLVNDSSATLRSKVPSRDHYASFTVFTAQTKTPEEYVEKLKKADETASKPRLKAARAEHEKWWEEFWDRSWIHVPADCQKTEFQELNITRWPLRIGVWSNLASEPYKGLVSRVRVSNRVLSDSEIAASASWDGVAVPQTDEAFLDWMFAAKDLTSGKTFKGLGSVKAEAKPSKAPEFATIAGREGLKVAEGKYVEMPETANLNYGPRATFEAWIAPEAYGARIVDLTMWDNKLYGLYISLLGDGRIAFSSHTKEIAGTSKLPLGQWSHVAATVDLSTGVYAVYVNGKKEASLTFPTPHGRRAGIQPPALHHRLRGPGRLSDQIQRHAVQHRHRRQFLGFPRVGRSLLAAEHAPGLLADAGVGRL